MKHELEMLLNEIKELIDSDNVELYVISDKKAEKVEEKEIDGRMREVLKMLELSSVDFANSMADVWRSINTAVDKADSVGAKKEMVEDINKVLDYITQDSEKVSLVVKEK